VVVDVSGPIGILIGDPVLVGQIVLDRGVGIGRSCLNEVGQVRGEQTTLGIMPGPRADPILGIDLIPVAVVGCAEECAPGLCRCRAPPSRRSPRRSYRRRAVQLPHPSRRSADHLPALGTSVERLGERHQVRKAGDEEAEGRVGGRRSTATGGATRARPAATVVPPPVPVPPLADAESLPHALTARDRMQTAAHPTVRPRMFKCMRFSPKDDEQDKWADETTNQSATGRPGRFDTSARWGNPSPGCRM